MFGTIAVIQIGLGWIFIRWLLNSDRGPKKPKKLLIVSGIFGFLATIAALVLEILFLPDKLSTDPGSLTFGGLLSGTMLIGLIEEGAKALPLAVFLLATRSIDEVTDGIIYFGISGMVFGVLEDIGYAFSLGPAAGIGKIVTGPFIHAGFCILVGWALCSVKMQRRAWMLALGGFVVAVTLHGLYDFGLFYAHGWSLLLSLAITIFVNLNIFWLMRVAHKADVKLGIAPEGNNLYCRECGRPNPKYYATSCTAASALELQASEWHGGRGLVERNVVSTTGKDIRSDEAQSLQLRQKA